MDQCDPSVARWPSTSPCGGHGSCQLTTTVDSAATFHSHYICVCSAGWSSDGDLIHAPHQYCHINHYLLLPLWLVALFSLLLLSHILVKSSIAHVRHYHQQQEKKATTIITSLMERRGMNIQMSEISRSAVTALPPTSGHTSSSTSSSNSSKTSLFTTLFHTLHHFFTWLVSSPTRRCFANVFLITVTFLILTIYKIVWMVKRMVGDDVDADGDGTDGTLTQDTEDRKRVEGLIGYDIFATFCYCLASLTFLVLIKSSALVWLHSAASFYSPTDHALLKKRIYSELQCSCIPDCICYILAAVALILARSHTPTRTRNSETGISIVSYYDVIEILVALHVQFKGIVGISGKIIERRIANLFGSHLREHALKQSRTRIKKKFRQAILEIAMKAEKELMMSSTPKKRQERLIQKVLTKLQAHTREGKESRRKMSSGIYKMEMIEQQQARLAALPPLPSAVAAGAAATTRTPSLDIDPGTTTIIRALPDPRRLTLLQLQLHHTQASPPLLTYHPPYTPSSRYPHLTQTTQTQNPALLDTSTASAGGTPHAQVEGEGSGGRAETPEFPLTLPQATRVVTPPPPTQFLLHARTQSTPNHRQTMSIQQQQQQEELEQSSTQDMEQLILLSPQLSIILPGAVGGSSENDTLLSIGAVPLLDIPSSTTPDLPGITITRDSSLIPISTPPSSLPPPSLTTPPTSPPPTIGMTPHKTLGTRSSTAGMAVATNIGGGGGGSSTNNTTTPGMSMLLKHMAAANANASRRSTRNSSNHSTTQMTMSQHMRNQSVPATSMTSGGGNARRKTLPRRPSRPSISSAATNTSNLDVVRPSTAANQPPIYATSPPPHHPRQLSSTLTNGRTQAEQQQDDHQAAILEFTTRLATHNRGSMRMSLLYFAINTIFAWIPLLRSFTPYLLPIQIFFSVAASYSFLSALTPKTHNNNHVAQQQHSQHQQQSTHQSPQQYPRESTRTTTVKAINAFEDEEKRAEGQQQVSQPE